MIGVNFVEFASISIAKAFDSAVEDLFVLQSRPRGMERLSEALASSLGPVVEELQPLTVDPPGRPRRLRRRLTWLLLRPGRLDRDEVARG